MRRINMRMNKHFIVSLICLPLLLSSCSSAISFENSPKYDDSTKHMSMYAYAAPGNGTYSIDGKEYQITDENGQAVTFQTKEMFQEYKDCGFDIIMFQADDPYKGEPFETSHLKSLMDLAFSVNLKSIVFDNRIHVLTNSKLSLLGYKERNIEAKQFVDQNDLNLYIADCMKDYRLHSSFMGLLLWDEPTYEMLTAIGQVYKAIKSVGDYFAQCNLLPFSQSDYNLYKKGATADSAVEAYTYYVNEFAKQTESNYIMFDSYPMTVSSDDSNINKIKIEHIKGMQIVAESCEKNNLDFYMVIQSCSWSNKGVRKTRACLMEDLLWQWNICLGMGVDQISYFTYQRKHTNFTSSGEYFDDGTSFISSNGTKSPVYYWAKEGHIGVQALSKIIMNFKYKGLRTYADGDASITPLSFLGGVSDLEAFEEIVTNDVNFTKEGVLFISEMYDENKKQYGYMILNLTDPSYKVTMNTEITFKEKNKAININYDDGSSKNIELNNHKANFTLSPGEGVFVMPF